MRTIITCIALAAACGGPTKPTPSNSGGTTETAKPAGAATGVSNLEWGASSATVSAAFPRATPNKDGGLWATGMTDGITSLTSFKMGPKGLESIAIEYTGGFVSMEDCLKTWTTLRAKYDGKFGKSTSDNGAAYWKTPTASIQLACNPNDSNAGVLSLSFAPPAAN